MAVRSQLLERSRQVKRRRKITKTTILLVLFFLILGLVIYLLNRPGLLINKIAVSGTKSVNSAEIIAFTNQQLASRYFWLVPKSNIYLWPKADVLANLKARFPRLDTVNFAVSGRAMSIAVTEKNSELLWCLLGENSKDCYFIDATGIAFARAPTFTDHVFFEIDTVVSASSTLPAGSVINTNVVSTNELSQILGQKEIIHQVLAEQKVFDRSIITAVSFGPGKAYTFEIVSPELSLDTWRLFTPTKISDQLGVALGALFESDAFVENVIHPKSQLNYVDSRLLNKLFFKTKDFHASSTIAIP